MKSLIVGIFLLSIVLVGLIVLRPAFVYNLLSFSYCDQPIHYRIDTVDPRFNLSREAFLSDISRGAGIWSDEYNKDLFIYDPKGDLSINLIYDERQSLTTQINQLENKVQSNQQVLKPQVGEYQRLSSEFKQKLENLNKEIEDWNNKGGAPPEVYESLIRQQAELQTEAAKLNTMARDLNISANNYNTQVDELNQTIDSLNNALEERPEEGVFKGPEFRIEIYFNSNKNELVHTIAHELGHALGIGHVNDPAAIMYSKTSKKITLTNDDILALGDACKEHSVFEILQVQARQMINNLQIQAKLVF